ncbi:Acyl- dehydrogenase family member mitochondrial [Brachionus plicatilis]|uniref:Acyl-dehydrogenase family member mitochondrial n=1 Tax=Brachionus plicatilis TaxID=10195 RepID=A0A3M7S1F3_BRAPC|nr:Acyl- dehydrogenase family member mitochondrial [Brachionus plicatilis]
MLRRSLFKSSVENLRQRCFSIQIARQQGDKNIDQIDNGGQSSKKSSSMDKSNRDFIQRLCTRPKQVRNKPFIKSLFKGEYLYDFLKYPEYEHNIFSESLDKHVQSIKAYFKTSNYGKIIDKNGNFSLEAISDFRSLGLFSKCLPIEYNGSELDSTGFARIIEETSTYPSLALNLINIQELVARSILAYGTQSQKDKILPQIARGEINAGFCYSEINNSFDPANFDLMARIGSVKGEKIYTLNGEKTWVSLLSNDNIEDALLVTFAKTFNEGSDKLNAFLVSAKSPGVSLKKVLSNQNGLSLYQVNFKEVVLSKEDILGEYGNGFEISSRIVDQSRYLVGAICIGLLKHLYKQTIDFSIQTYRYGKSISQFPLIKARLACVEHKLYTMESMVYLTAGVVDTYDMPDVGCEAALTKIFCTETLRECVSHCLDIMAMGQFINLDKLTQKYLSDVSYLVNALNTNDLLRLYVGTNGLVLSGAEFGDELSKVRNPLKYPGFLLRQILINHKLIRSAQKKIPQYFYLWEHVHPSLQEPVSVLEQSAVKLMMAAKSTIINHGRDVIDNQVPLAMLADMAMHIYAMNSAIARASRSYSIGLPNSQHEVALVFVQCKESGKIVDEMHADIISSRGGEGLNNTKFNIADNVLKVKNHAASHSISRNY